MARTMAANLTGARLRDFDQALRDARGAAAVDALMKAHPHEAKVLQHLFDERRAGRPVPPLLRIARVMIWSDGAMEFRLVDSLAPIGGATAPQASAPGSPGGRSSFGQAGASRSPEVGRSPSAGPIRGGTGPAGPARTGRPAWGDRGQGVGPSGGAPVGTGAPRLRTAWVGGTRLDPAPRQFRRRPGEDDDVGWGDAPRAGEGWSVVRPGDVLPMNSGGPPLSEVYTQATAENSGGVGEGQGAPARSPSLEIDGADGGDQSSLYDLGEGREPLTGEVSEAAESAPDPLVPGEALSGPALHASPPRDAAEGRGDLELGRHVTPAVAAITAADDDHDSVVGGTNGEIAVDAEAGAETAPGGPNIEPDAGPAMTADPVDAEGDEVGRVPVVSAAITADAPGSEGANIGTQSPNDELAQ